MRICHYCGKPAKSDYRCLTKYFIRPRRSDDKQKHLYAHHECYRKHRAEDDKCWRRSKW